MPIDQLIVIDWFSFFMRFIFSQDFQKQGLFMHFNDENCDKTLIFFTTVIDTSWRTWAYDFMNINFQLGIKLLDELWWNLWSKKINGRRFKIEYHPM